MLSMLGKNFSRQYFEIYFFFLFFPENKIWHFMQIASLGDNLLEMSKPIFRENKKISVFFVCCIYPESGKG